MILLLIQISLEICFNTCNLIALQEIAAQKKAKVLYLKFDIACLFLRRTY